MSENTILGFVMVDADGNCYEVVENSQKTSVYTINADGELEKVKYCLLDGSAVIQLDKKNFEIIPTGKKLQKIDA